MKTKLTTLENGLRIITTEMPTETAVVSIFVQYGSKYETPETNGTAHFLEHALFLGSKTRSGEQLSKEFDEIAAHTNGYTCVSYTEFVAMVLKDDIYKAIELYADIIQHPRFDEKSIKNEKKVISREIYRVKNNNFLSSSDTIQAAYRCPKYAIYPVGNAKVLSKTSIEKLKEIWSLYYTAPNIIVSIAGGIDYEEIVKYCELVFSDLSSKPAPEATTYQYCGGSVFTKIQSSPEVILAFDGHDGKDSVAGALLAFIFGGDYNSRLYNNIRKKYGNVYAMGASLGTTPYGDVFRIFFEALENDCAEVCSLIFKEIVDICLNEVSEEELKIAKKKLIASQIAVFESSMNCAPFFGSNMANQNQLFTHEIILEKIDDVSLNEIRKVACKIFSSRPTYIIYGTNLNNFLSYETICGMYIAHVNKY